MAALSLVLDRARGGLRRELGPLLALAGPVVVAELGWMSMGVVDTMLVGRVSPAALGGVSIGGSLFAAVAITGMGMLLGLDYLVAHAHGGGRAEDAHRSLLHGIYLALGLSAVIMTLVAAGTRELHRLEIDPAVLAQAVPYLRALNWGLPPLLLYMALRRYLQALSLVRPITLALVAANIVNALVAWVLIFGRWGAPAMGAAGAGWATCVARTYLLFHLATYLLWRERKLKTGLMGVKLHLEAGRLQRLISLGAPAAAQMALEVGVFAVATALVGRLGATPLAAHQVALVVASVTFMVPLGVSSAGAVRVGQALGRRDPATARRAGWTALFLGTAFMTVSALTLALIPHLIMRAFTADPAVIATGVALLRVAALFQLFDGLQVVATGVLRGTGDTRMPMIANLIGHWCLGLPVGCLLGLKLGGGVVGLWSGLCLGLMCCGTFLLIVWSRRVRRLMGKPWPDQRPGP